MDSKCGNCEFYSADNTCKWWFIEVTESKSICGEFITRNNKNQKEE